MLQCNPGITKCKGTVRLCSCMFVFDRGGGGGHLEQEPEIKFSSYMKGVFFGVLFHTILD